VVCGVNDICSIIVHPTLLQYCLTSNKYFLLGLYSGFCSQVPFCGHVHIIGVCVCVCVCTRGGGGGKWPETLRRIIGSAGDRAKIALAIND
jgi:hypothetical protein